MDYNIRLTDICCQEQVPVGDSGVCVYVLASHGLDPAEGQPRSGWLASACSLACICNMLIAYSTAGSVGVCSKWEIVAPCGARRLQISAPGFQIVARTACQCIWGPLSLRVARLSACAYQVPGLQTTRCIST